MNRLTKTRLLRRVFGRTLWPAPGSEDTESFGSLWKTGAVSSGPYYPAHASIGGTPGPFICILRIV